MPAEVFHQGGKGCIVAAVQDGQVGQIGQQPFAPGRPALIQQRGVERVGAGIDPVAQRCAAGFGKGRLLQRPIFQPDDAPAKGGKNRLGPFPQPFMDHAIQTLAVVVDHPPDMAQIVFPTLQQRLVNIALVQFGVANQRDHAAQRGGAPAVAVQVILNKRGKDRQGRAKADRAGGKIHIVGVFGPRRIGLHAAPAPEVRQFFPALLPHQILDRMKHRPGMGFDRNPVLRAQSVEIKCCQNADRGGTAGLMAAYLDIAIGFGAQVVGVVDRPASEPEEAAFKLFQQGKVSHGRSGFLN